MSLWYTDLDSLWDIHTGNVPGSYDVPGSYGCYYYIYNVAFSCGFTRACEPMQVEGRDERRESCFKMLFLFSETYFFLSVLEVTDSASLPGKQTSDE